MAISSHCQTIDRRTERGEFHGNARGEYVICPSGKKWRVYEDATGYSQTSGITLQRGKVMRSTSGKPITFATQAEATAWIDGGCQLLDGKCRELFP